MKEILEKIFGKKIEFIHFKQDIDVYPKQYKDGEIYETEVNSYNLHIILILLMGQKLY